MIGLELMCPNSPKDIPVTINLNLFFFDFLKK